MGEPERVEKRIEAALDRLEAALAGAGGAAGAASRIEDLEAENRALAAQLEALGEERRKDLDQLDTLIAQLRPLVEEAS